MGEKENDKKSLDSKPDKDLELKELCRVWGPFEADIVKSFLESHGVSCLVRGRMVPFVYPFTVDGLAEFRILVPEKDLEKAQDLLAAMPTPDDEGGNAETG
jgi:hypothetical protein